MVLDNLLTTVFGRSKGKPSNSGSGRNSQDGSSSGPSSMTGPFYTPTTQMPQPPSLPYPVAPYPATDQTANSVYPSLPFDQPPMPPMPPTPSTLKHDHTNFNPLESVPFEVQLNMTRSTNIVTLDSVFKDMKQAIEKVDRADAYLKSRDSYYDFKTEQGPMY